jgi:hypothetical protein
MPIGPSQWIQYFTGWRASLQRVIPIWQQQRPNAVIGFRWLWSLITPLDISLENTLQGINDWAPGSPDASPTALPLIAQSRGLIQGEAETNDHFAARLRNWRTNGLAVAPPASPQVWNQTGKTELLAQQIQQYLGNNPLVRVIQRIYSTSGTPMARYTTANTDGSTSVATAAWDWDSLSGGEDRTQNFTGAEARTFWCDTWIVVYPGEWSIAGSITPLTGQHVPLVAHDAILRIVAQWKGLHTFVRAIIFSYNALLFDPATPGHAGNPDGTWGRWAKTDGSGNQVPARNNVDARYWIPAEG